ncbi:uncharacterized protein LOC143225264 [Tachypleus tridentatus]|uniref:uncharacterized protein LOC143225264 n=1 Tax=Tachypleus tridentatus TaxID=6853 RepID=UPI003FCFF05E
MGCNISKVMKVRANHKDDETNGGRKKNYRLQTKQRESESKNKEIHNAETENRNLEKNEEMLKTETSFPELKEKQELRTMKKGEATPKTQEVEEMNIDLNDTSLTKAATKIQASFRGHKVRKEIKNQEEGCKELHLNKQEFVNEELDLTDPELMKAATKIQATFRGYQTRRNIIDQEKDEK